MGSLSTERRTLAHHYRGERTRHALPHLILSHRGRFRLTIAFSISRPPILQRRQLRLTAAKGFELRAGTQAQATDSHSWIPERVPRTGSPCGGCRDGRMLVALVGGRGRRDEEVELVVGVVTVVLTAVLVVVWGSVRWGDY